jgi:hypothetical protein
MIREGEGGFSIHVDLSVFIHWLGNSAISQNKQEPAALNKVCLFLKT